MEILQSLRNENLFGTDPWNRNTKASAKPVTFLNIEKKETECPKMKEQEERR